MCVKKNWSWENMHFDMNQTRKRREEEESVIRDSIKELDFFFFPENMRA